MHDRRWEEAVKLRGISFTRNLQTYNMLTRIQPPSFNELSDQTKTGFRLAVMHCGAPSCGM